MDNVNKLLIGNIQSDLEDIIAFNIDRAIKGELGQFIFGLDSYLGADDALKEYYVQKGKIAIVGLILSNPKCKVSLDLINELPSTYFAFNGALEEGVLIGFDMEKEGCPRALYTRNFDIVRQLASMGSISNADKIDKAESSVKGVKTINGIKSVEEALIGVARLDFEGIVSGKPVYKVTVPQQPLRVGLNNPILMTPLKAMYILSSKLDVLFSKQIVRFTESTVKGVKQGIVTSNNSVVSDVYSRGGIVSAYEPNFLDKKLSLIDSGYNYNLLRYFTYDLESSVYSKGYSTFRPEMLDRLEVVGLSSIDKSKHYINYRLLRSIYKDKVNALSLDDLYTVNFCDLSTFATVDDKCTALLLHGEDLGDTELYTLMKQNSSLFGNLVEELSDAEARVPTIVKNLKIVNIPKTTDQFTDMLNNGLVRVTTLTKKGRVMEVNASNNKKILVSMLGRDYVREFESTRYKYEEFKKVISRTQFTSRGQLETLALKYGIDMGIVVDSVAIDFTGDVSALIQGVDSILDNLKGKNKTLSPTQVTVRKVYAKDKNDLYTIIDVSQIKQIEYASLV